MGTSLKVYGRSNISSFVAPWNKNMLRVTLLSLALAHVVSSLTVNAASSPCTDLQDLGFALSFGTRSPCKRTVYRSNHWNQPVNDLSLDLEPNRIEPKYNRIEPKYNPTFWRLINMLESIQQSHLGKRAKEEEVKEEKKWKLPNRIFPNFPMIAFYNTI